jgi:hypothetical protein
MKTWPVRCFHSVAVLSESYCVYLTHVIMVSRMCSATSSHIESLLLPACPWCELTGNLNMFEIGDCFCSDIKKHSI